MIFKLSRRDTPVRSRKITLLLLLFYLLLATVVLLN